MGDLQYETFCIFKNDRYDKDQENAAWTLRPVHHIYKAVNIIHAAMQTTFSRQIFFSGHEKYIMFKKAIDLPTGNVSLVNDVKKKVWSSSKSFAFMEKKMIESNSDYYQVLDSEEEDEIEKLDSMQSETDKSNEERNSARSVIYKIVEEIEDISFKILSIDMLQNKRKYRLHKSWADIMEIPFDDCVTAYHGTSVSALESGIVKFGLCGKEGIRGLFGTGIYLAKYFDTAKDYAREKRNNNEEMIVLVVRCLLGKIKTVDMALGNYKDFIDNNGDVCNTKYIPNLNYWIVSDDAAIVCEYACRFQIIDDVKVFPASKQVEMDKKRKRESEELQAKMAQDRIDAKAKYDQDRIDAKAKSDQDKANKDASDANKRDKKKDKDKLHARAAYSESDKIIKTDEEKIEIAEKKKLRLLQKQMPIPSKRINLDYSNDIYKGEPVLLHNLSNSDNFLENKTGRVKLIIEERNKKIVFMVEMNEDGLLDTIRRNNKRREVNNKGTGYSRYGSLMNESYFICQRKHLKKIDRNQMSPQDPISDSDFDSD